MRISSLSIFFFVLVNFSLFAQEIPSEFFLRQIYSSLINEESYFKNHSTLGPLRYGSVFLKMNF